MTTYICKCGQRVQKSSNADNTGNRLEGYGPGHECYGCPYAMPWGGNKWDKAAKRFVQDIKGYECRTSRTLSYDSHFIGSTEDKCTCSVVSLDFDFLEHISAWVKDTFPLGELTGGFSQDEIRPTDYSHNGRYCCTFVCASNKKGIAAKAALFARFFDPDGSRKDMTPQQEMEKILADIRKCTQEPPAAEDVAVAALSPQSSASAPVVPAETSFASAAVPSFDFSALGDLSQQATEADQQFDLHYGAAQDEYLISCIYLARIHALTAKAGRYGGGTWTKWYESKGMSKSGAWNMVQTGESFNGSTIDQLKQLPELTRKDLNLIARSGCAGQLVETAGDSQRVQELLAQLKAKEYKLNETQARLKSACIQEQESRDAMNTANAQLEAANADIKGLTEQNNQLKSRLDAAEAREEEAWKMQTKAEQRAKTAESQLEGSRQVAEAANRRADKWRSEAEAARKQPIVAVVDEDEVDRRAAEKAWGLADARNAELAKDNASLKKQVAALHSKISDATQADFENANSIAFSCRRAWDTGKGSYSRLVGEDLETTFASLCETLNSIREEAARLCRQPPEYDGGGEDE
jgi:hypothetical protein